MGDKLAICLVYTGWCLLSSWFMMSGINIQPPADSIYYNLPLKSLIQTIITVSCLCVIVSPTQDRYLVYLLMS